MLSALAVRRLTKLADYMHGLPKSAEKHFDMCVVGPTGRVTKKMLLSCNTSACAMGWAATIPSFRKAGWTDGWIMSEERFFDIDYTSARHLFYTADLKTPKEWAAHCRKFIKENRA